MRDMGRKIRAGTLRKAAAVGIHIEIHPNGEKPIYMRIKGIINIKKNWLGRWSIYMHCGPKRINRRSLSLMPSSHTSCDAHSALFRFRRIRRIWIRWLYMRSWDRYRGRYMAQKSMPRKMAAACCELIICLVHPSMCVCECVFFSVRCVWTKKV